MGVRSRQAYRLGGTGGAGRRPGGPFSSCGAPAVSGSPAGDYRQERVQEGRENPRDERREHQDEDDQDSGRYPPAEREVDDKGGQYQENEDLDWTDNGHDLLRLPSNASSYPPDPVKVPSRIFVPRGFFRGRVVRLPAAS